MFHNKVSKLVIAAIAINVFSAQAALIQFENITPPPPNYGYIPDGYGSTAEVDLSYQTMNLDGSVYSSHMQFWGTGYADLPAAAYSDGSNRFAEVTLTPKSGEAVTLNAFDMAAYPTGISGRDESEISIIYGNKLISYGPTTLSGNSVTHFTPSVTYTGPITIRFGTDWDNGINNINFNATAVPEPSTYGLMATAIMGLLCYRNRKQ